MKPEPELKLELIPDSNPKRAVSDALKTWADSLIDGILFELTGKSASVEEEETELRNRYSKRERA